MTDLVFVVEEDRLLSKRPSPLRNRMLERLELRAVVEEVVDAENRELADRNVRRTSRNNHVYGTDEFHYVPPKGV